MLPSEPSAHAAPRLTPARDDLSESTGLPAFGVQFHVLRADYQIAAVD
jgi:hypothetical protein